MEIFLNLSFLNRWLEHLISWQKCRVNYLLNEVKSPKYTPLFKQKSWLTLPKDTGLSYSCLHEVIAPFLKNWSLTCSKIREREVNADISGGIHSTAWDSSVMRITFEKTHLFCLKWKNAEGEIKNWSVLYFWIWQASVIIMSLFFLFAVAKQILNVTWGLFIFCQSPDLNSMCKNKTNVVLHLCFLCGCGTRALVST